MHVSAHMCGGHRLTPGVFYLFSFFLTVFLEGLSLNLDLTRLGASCLCPGSSEAKGHTAMLSFYVGAVLLLARASLPCPSPTPVDQIFPPLQPKFCKVYMLEF